MSPTSPWFSVLWALCLFVGILLTVEVGRWFGRRRLGRNPEEVTEGIGALENSLFGLLGLLIAFTFGGALTRFEARRGLITQETNAIGTAWLRLDLLPEPVRSETRELFRQYLTRRIDFHGNAEDQKKARDFTSVTVEIEADIWSRAVKACETAPRPDIDKLVLPALNEMFDIATTRRMALLNHPPVIIFVMLFVLALGCGVIAGNSIANSKKWDWIHGVSFALLTALCVFVILDLEFPRAGFIRIDGADVALIALRKSMK